MSKNSGVFEYINIFGEFEKHLEFFKDVFGWKEVEGKEGKRFERMEDLLFGS